MRERRKAYEIVRFVGVALALAVLAPAPEAQAGGPIEIKTIDAKTGRVTARDVTSGQAFDFQLQDKRALGKLRAGQQLAADFGDSAGGGDKGIIIVNGRGSLKLSSGESVGIIVIGGGLPAKSGRVAPGAAQGFDPQPDPPKVIAPGAAR
jgi:hypothetical protein